MKSHRYSRAALHMTLRWCAAAVVVCGLAVGVASTRRVAAQHRNELSAQRTQSARTRLDRASERRALTDAFRDRYVQLAQEGLTVRFDRAVAGDWFEAATHTRPVGTVDHYVIGKDTPFAGPETAELTAFRVVSHRLDFTAAVADEDDFAAFMNSIEKRLPGTTAQEACSLSRNRASEGDERLALQCAVIWYEFAPADGAPAVTLAGT